MLATQFREAQAWPALAELLRDGATHDSDPSVKIDWLREAAEIHVRHLDEPAAAVPLLEEASDLAEKLGAPPPGGRDRVRPLRVALADALRRAGRNDEARLLLDGLVEWYGRRRPPERAQVHVQLAHLARARGDNADALAQLELASTMDMGSAEILKLLGSLAREEGDYARAERAYRALLLIVRRPGAVLDAPIGPSEVLFELHRIAAAQGQEDRAHENLESAFEAASENEDEGQRFVQLLRDTHNEAFLVRALRARVDVEQDPNAAATTLIELADVLDGLDRVDEALQARLDALAHVPDSITLHAAVRDVARRAGKLERYEERLRELAERASDAGENAAAAGFFLRMAELLEQDLGDLNRAAEAYARAEKTGEQTVAVQRGIARVARTRGDKSAEIAALRQIVQIDDQDPALRTESLYRLAELCMTDEATRGEGVEMLTWAVDREAQNDRALAMLRAVTDHDERVATLQERVARASGDPGLLLEAIERLSASESPSLDIVREGAELAVKAGETSRAEALLRRTIEIARANDLLADAAWALIALAEQRKAAGDAKGAIPLLLEAADASSGESFDLRLSAAQLAAGPGEDLKLAASTYESLLERDAGDQRVWAPLLEVLRRLGDRTKLEKLIADTIENVFDASERNVLRLERVRLLLDDKGREDEAATALREILDDEPEQEGAANLLMDLYQRTNRKSELVDLARDRLALAREKKDLPRIAELSLRLGGLLDREEALEILRDASTLVPDDKALLQAQVKLLKPNDDPNVRAETLEKLLALETGDVAAATAIEAANVRQTMNDEEGVVRVLDRGFREAPTNEKLRLRLEKALTTRNDFKKLAEVYAIDARGRRDKRAGLARFRDAAKLYLEKLSDPASAATVLREARELAPDDVNLAIDLARARGAAGEHASAIEELTGMLDQGKLADTMRVTLLKARAELHTHAHATAKAVEDLEAAYALSTAVAPDLIAALERRREATKRDLEAERGVVNRLVEVLSATNDNDKAHEVLVGWTTRDPNDKDALRTLAAIDNARGDHSGVVDAYLKLVRIEQGTPQADAALLLADAADQCDRQEEARQALEFAVKGNADDDRLRTRLRVVYEAVGAYSELAALTLLDAQHAPDANTKFDMLLAAGDLYLRSVGEESRAIEPLEAALKLKPFHHETILLLADAYTISSDIDKAMELLTPAIDKHKNRRSKELAALQHRMARAANAGGGRDVEMQWLVKAMECDMQNGQVAAELAEVAIELRQFEIALKALKAVTLLRTPGPMSRALATLRQGQIAYQQGDAKRAVLLAKKALAEEPSLSEAESFLREVGA
jgi:lipopolysaccharide biosynthesis regulator YciM